MGINVIFAIFPPSQGPILEFKQWDHDNVSYSNGNGIHSDKLSHGDLPLVLQEITGKVNSDGFTVSKRLQHYYYDEPKAQYGGTTSTLELSL